MAKFNGFRCEICPETRKESNNWFIGKVLPNGGASVVPWDASNPNNSKAQHLCGLDCSSKFLMRTLSNTIHNITTSQLNTTAQQLNTTLKEP